MLSPSRVHVSQVVGCLFLCLLSLASKGLLAATPDAEAGTTLKRAKAAWAKRQEGVNCAQFVWNERAVFPKGSVMNPKTRPRYNPRGLTIPASDFTCNVPYTLRFVEDKLYYSYDGYLFSSQTGQPVRQQYFSAFNGTDSKIYWPQGLDRMPSGVVRREARCIDAGNIHARAILVTYRSLNPDMGITWREFTVSNRRGYVRDVPCIILEQKPVPGSYQHTSYWIDPQQDYSIRRYMLTQNQQVIEKLDINYTRDGAQGWVPTSWEGVRFGRDRSAPKESFSASVKSFLFNNCAEVGDADIRFPPGTWVGDEKAKKNYLVKPTGEHRTITDEERDATYEQLLNSESGQALSETSWLSSRTIVIILSIGLCVAFGAYWVRHQLRLSKDRNNRPRS